VQLLKHLLVSIVGVGLIAGAAQAGGTTGVLRAKKVHSGKHWNVFHSPDHKFQAVLVLGEGEATTMTVRSYPATKAPAVLSEVDVVGIIWDPAKPHRMIYAESEIYGTGKIAVWSGGKETVLWKKGKAVKDLSWNRNTGRLTFSTLEMEGLPDKWIKHSIPFR